VPRSCRPNINALTVDAAARSRRVCGSWGLLAASALRQVAQNAGVGHGSRSQVGQITTTPHMLTEAAKHVLMLAKEAFPICPPEFAIARATIAASRHRRRCRWS
jgi:hypothetical protein